MGEVKEMNEIIRILMRRDDLTYEEAKEAYEDCRAEIMEALEGSSCLSLDEILQSELGLEPDYIFDFI